MPTPQPFEPRWRAEIGAARHEGKGLLGVIPPGLIDCFIAFADNHAVVVWPKLGLVVRGGEKIQCPPGPLVWKRTMQFHIGTHDNNSTAPECVHYHVGIESGETYFGYRLLKNGRTILS